MEDWSIDISVIFFIFKRRDITYRVFEKIKEAKPRRLFIVSDGPRKEIEGESEEVAKTREIINGINWNCEIHTNFSDENMGCDKRIVSGITWAFQYTDRAIILEDDCLPTKQFFIFGKTMLDKYANEKGIAYISGEIGVRGYKYPYDYFYSYLGYTWGWATWRDRWKLFEYGTERFNSKKKTYMKGIFDETVRKNRLANMERHFNQGDFPWDDIWDICTDGMLRIVPKENLVENIGFAEGSTHTFMKPHGYYGKVGTISEEFTHPQQINNNQSYIEWFQKRAKYHLWNKALGKCRWLIYHKRQNKKRNL